MSKTLLLVANGAPQLAIFYPADACPIVKNAAQLFVDEVKQKSGTAIDLREAGDWKTGSSCSALAIAPDGESFSGIDGLIPDVSSDSPEAFHIRSSAETLVVSAASGAGVLYGVDHLLDTMQCKVAGTTVDASDRDDKPDNLWRGASFSTHSYGRYVEDRNDLELMKQQIRFYARNRLNIMTVEATGRKWPGDLSPVVTWKYFPALQDPTRDEMVELRRKHANELITYAHSWGIKVVLYTSEFNHEPDIYERCPELHGVLPETWRDGLSNYVRGCICLSKDIAWQYLDAKVRETLEALPELDGLEIWTAEVPSEFGICACDSCQSKKRHEWLEKLYSEVRKSIDSVRPGMLLVAKTFQSSQGSLEVERFAPLKGKLPSNTVVSTKCQFGDMAYLNDPHPLLGFIQDGGEATEFDMGGEYRGCGMSAMICCIPEYIAERMRLYHSRGLRRFFARHAVPTWPNKEFLDINDTTFYRLAWDLNADVEDIWQSWAAERFGKEAGPGMVDVLKMTDEVINKSLYIRDACANRHYWIFPDNLDSFRYMMVDLSAMMIDGGLDRLEPTPENIQAIVEEKEEAIRIHHQMVVKFQKVSLLLDEETRQKLEGIFLRTERIIIIMRYLAEAVFHYFRYERCFSVRERDGMRPDLLRMLKRCEEEILISEKMPVERISGETFWGMWKVVDFDRARRLCDEIRGLLNFRIGQRADYTMTMVPATIGHPNTYALHRKQLREVFGLPGEG